MRVYGAECDMLAEAERSAVEAFAGLYEPLCSRLRYVSLYVWETEDGSWVDTYGRKVAGLMWCDLATMELGSDDWQINAYFHEMAHLAQCPEQDASHSTWEALGIWESIEALKAKGLHKARPDYLSDTAAP
jgi:hypothetical protein